ncbi:hypothetical protein [Oceanirhabdus sp. W0125-5]|uniref:hypothetical protein n=1 Tax=Oceanirhabdus sp. W0125-5 TaxID=2999116 RepID=UPI0022F34426|nr:hypothetical protein [Oceanirhabdus sp. W0125-5]WBW99559.1 hypothetical protein OW730_12670 [Oceanirhabdus sp. W0125-5]
MKRFKKISGVLAIAMCLMICFSTTASAYIPCHECGEQIGTCIHTCSHTNTYTYESGWKLSREWRTNIGIWSNVWCYEKRYVQTVKEKCRSCGTTLNTHYEERITHSKDHVLN